MDYLEQKESMNEKARTVLGIVKPVLVVLLPFSLNFQYISC